LHFPAIPFPFSAGFVIVGRQSADRKLFSNIHLIQWECISENNNLKAGLLNNAGRKVCHRSGRSWECSVYGGGTMAAPQQ